MDFFIVGFPRSRLAWISNYLTYGYQACFFDAFAKGLDGSGPACIDDYQDVAESVGIADSGAVMFQDRLRKKYPDAKWIIIERSYIEVVASLKKLGIKPDQRLSTLHYKMSELKMKINPLIVPFDSLNSSMPEIGKFINPKWHCPAWRHEMLTGLNVQSSLTKKDLDKIPAVNPLSEEAEPVTPTNTQAEYFKLLQEICADNQFAYRWLEQLIFAATTMDHIYDGDPIDYTIMDGSFKALLLEWGINPFFRQYATQLVPPMSAAISAWEHSPERSGHYNIYTELPCVVAFILGGQERVAQFSQKLRALVNSLMMEDEERDGS